VGLYFYLNISLSQVNDQKLFDTSLNVVKCIMQCRENSSLEIILFVMIQKSVL